jgi:hypothetical protein
VAERFGILVDVISHQETNRSKLSDRQHGWSRGTLRFRWRALPCQLTHMTVEVELAHLRSTACASRSPRAR